MPLADIFSFHLKFCLTAHNLGQACSTNVILSPTSCEELTHWKRLWCWEGLGARGEGDARGWDGWMASLTRWTWVWVNSGSWWWTGRPGVLRFMGSQIVGHDWATELNWIFHCVCSRCVCVYHFLFIHSPFSTHLGCSHILLLWILLQWTECAYIYSN